ncbi:UbiA family prenyltransferase [Nocardioides sp.]|uniref:UbiA family prenyltransferase n=1 Tax=Nocardioides sp. TaxID=35761 RepID=UPI001A1B74F6|nr:UbiA family prenyltransferase [Nocardioides sp.]MBJ7357662.1 UbiA family prenyltransferase [Nocardioides sp.]
MVAIRRRRRGEDVVEPTDEPATAPVDGPAPAEDRPDEQALEDEPRPFSLRNLTPVLVVRAAHPRQALVTALGVGVAAALAGRPTRELLLVMSTVLVGQACLGWFNDLVDRRRDARHHAAGKPVADGRLDPGTVWFVLAVGVFVVVPLAVANGVYAGTAYLASLGAAVLGTWIWVRKGFFSWLPWAASYGLLPAFLSYGGWGGQDNGAPPEVLVTVLAAALGIGVHFLRALWGLVPDNADGWTYLPLKLGLRLGASRLLWVSSVYTVGVLVALAFAATAVGLSQ